MPQPHQMLRVLKELKKEKCDSFGVVLKSGTRLRFTRVCSIWKERRKYFVQFHGLRIDQTDGEKHGHSFFTVNIDDILEIQ